MFHFTTPALACVIITHTDSWNGPDNSTILNAGRLTQQFAIEAWAKDEQNDLQWKASKEGQKTLLKNLALVQQKT